MAGKRIKRTISGSGRIKNGKFEVANYDFICERAAELFGKDFPVQFDIYSYVNSKTTPQNNYFVGVICSIWHKALIESGNDTVTIELENGLSYTERLQPEHSRHLLYQYVGVKRMVDGKSELVTASTATKSEMMELIEASKRYLETEWGLKVPDPEDYKKL